MDKQRLLNEIDDLIGTIPQDVLAETADSIEWLGRLKAVLKRWDRGTASKIDRVVSGGSSRHLRDEQPQSLVLRMLHDAREDILLDLPYETSVSHRVGMVFDYYDSVRKIIESANEEIFFVDPFFDANFVSRYIVHVKSGVRVRMLGRENSSKVSASLAILSEQCPSIEVEFRTVDGFHDRHIVVDRRFCHQSGASFKDGARNSPTILTEITDAADEVMKTYESYWAKASHRFASTTKSTSLSSGSA